MKKLSTILIVAALFLVLCLVVKQVEAAIRCETYYEGEVCIRTGELQIDKKVWDRVDNQYQDNLYLTSEDYQFGPGEIVTFSLKITNVGDETFDKVYVKDTLPKYLVLESGDLEFEIEDLSPGETEKREIEARVVSSEEFPADLEICEPNTAEVWSGDEGDKDTAQVCMKEKVLGVVELPPTGPNLWLPLLVSTATLGSLGLYFLKLNQN